jgi:DNA-binding MarR family transcriptional regulator
MVADRFAERIATLDLKPKHAGVLVALSIESGLSQQELAARMRVAPSLVVTLADHLENMGAIERIRDPGDRRRQNLALTRKGRDLLAKCARLAEDLDHKLTAELAEQDRARLHHVLGVLATREGLP